MNYYRYHSPQFTYYRPRLFQGAIRSIIIANVVVYLFMRFFRVETFFLHFGGLVPQLILRGYVWQLVTYFFIHGGFWHLFWNMFVLWMFGTEIENYWGRKAFLKYYFFTGIGSGLITFLCSLNSSIPVVGASGAIYGILVAFGMLFPERYIYFYFLIPIKAKYFVWIMAGITFFSTLSPNISNISHLTHLGGLLVGYLYLKAGQFSPIRRRWRWEVLWRPFQSLKHRLEAVWRRFFRSTRQRKTSTYHYETEETMREELDRILDQISRYGYESLTETEKSTLLLLSRYFADRDRMKD